MYDTVLHTYSSTISPSEKPSLVPISLVDPLVPLLKSSLPSVVRSLSPCLSLSRPISMSLTFCLFTSRLPRERRPHESENWWYPHCSEQSLAPGRESAKVRYPMTPQPFPSLVPQASGVRPATGSPIKTHLSYRGALCGCGEGSAWTRLEVGSWAPGDGRLLGPGFSSTGVFRS